MKTLSTKAQNPTLRDAFNLVKRRRIPYRVFADNVAKMMGVAPSMTFYKRIMGYKYPIKGYGFRWPAFQLEQAIKTWINVNK